jgi:hypothetical protein
MQSADADAERRQQASVAHQQRIVVRRRHRRRLERRELIAAQSDAFVEHSTNATEHVLVEIRVQHVEERRALPDAARVDDTTRQRAVVVRKHKRRRLLRVTVGQTTVASNVSCDVSKSIKTRPLAAGCRTYVRLANGKLVDESRDRESADARR